MKKKLAAIAVVFVTATGLNIATAPSAEAFYWCPGWFCRR